MSRPRFIVVRRAPRAGERGWWVEQDRDWRAIHRSILYGMHGASIEELGWESHGDTPHVDPDDDMISVTILPWSQVLAAMTVHAHERNDNGDATGRTVCGLSWADDPTVRTSDGGHEGFGAPSDITCHACRVTS